MPRRSRPSSSSRTDSPSSSKRLARIDSAFNTAAGYVDPATTTSTTARAPQGLSAKARGKRRAVVEDDEEDEEEGGMEGVQSGGDGGGGFLLEGEEEGMQLDEAGAAGGGGGGFLPEPDFSADGGGGGFLPETTSAGGGFLPGPPAGGFLPDDSAVAGRGGFLAGDSAAEGGFLPDPPPLAGGFLPDPSFTAAPDSPMPDASPAFGGGGFFASALPGDASFSGAGGFLPDDDNDEGTDNTSFELPTPAPLAHDSSALPPPPDAFFSALGTTPSSHTFNLPFPPPAAPAPPPDRIPLHSIPSALRQLGLHNRGLPAAELLELFDDVASDDESLPGGGKSVRRERFREACEVLLGDESDDEEEGGGEEGEGEDGKGGGEDYRGEEDEDDAPVVRRRRHLARTTRSSTAAAKRSTRASRVVDEEDEEGEEEEEDGAEVKEKDFGAQLDDLPSESSADEDDFDDAEEEDSDGEPLSSLNKKKQPSAAKATGRTRRRRGRGGGEDILLTDQDLADAEDSFDLFFVDSVQQGKERGERAIGLMELQRACRVLKEKLGEGELNEMLEYAARSKGKVDLEAFARILVETGL